MKTFLMLFVAFLAIMKTYATEQPTVVLTVVSLRAVESPSNRDWPAVTFTLDYTVQAVDREIFLQDVPFWDFQSDTGNYTFTYDLQATVPLQKNSLCMPYYEVDQGKTEEFKFIVNGFADVGSKVSMNVDAIGIHLTPPPDDNSVWSGWDVSVNQSSTPLTIAPTPEPTIGLLLCCSSLLFAVRRTRRK